MHDAMELNRRHWDDATEAHARGNIYGLEDFRRGMCRLHRVELAEVGDVSGKSLLHLQCHFGLDTLSWARRGAKVTGVDFSPKAVELARLLASDSGIPATFVCCNLYDVRDSLPGGGTFDVIFTSHGALCWLPDLKPWAQIIAHYLKPGGVFYVADAHPMGRIFPTEADINENPGIDPARPFFPYFGAAEGMRWPASADYADPTITTGPSHDWQHTLADIVGALLGAGLVLEFLHEFPFCAWRAIPAMVQVERFSDSHRYWGMPAGTPSLPLMFSIRARKPETTTTTKE
ncbi:MAG: Methyltransferase type 11 [Phycisphaerales bacterium]|nr:Methyltransferase type 11 [Phycisphaerales bacterium]